MNRCRRCDFQAETHDALVEHAQPANASHPLCICCYRSLYLDERQTCVHCLGAARRDLRTVVELYALLPEQLVDAGGSNFKPYGSPSSDTKVPGGDALVLLGGGHVGTGDRDAKPDDPEPVLPLLASWEDDFRHTRKDPAGGKATMTTTAAYLERHLGWAATDHPAFDDFVDDLRRCRARLESVLRAGPQRSPVLCITCGRRALERPDADRTDKNGTEILWRCSHCHCSYTPAQYWQALRDELDREEAAS